MTQGTRQGERGSVSVQLTMLLPALLLFVWVAMGVAMYHYGSTAAQSAAQLGAAVAAAEGGTTDACEAAALAFTSRLGDAIRQVTATCERTATTVTATISGRTLSLVPGWSPTITQTATVPVERLT